MAKPIKLSTRQRVEDAIRQTADVLGRTSLVGHVRNMAKQSPSRLHRDMLEGRTDAALTFYIARELEALKSKVYADKYRPNKAMELIPVVSDVDPGAEQVAWLEETMGGIAKIISDYADDLPASDVGTRKNNREVLTVGGSYSFSIKEIYAATFAGRSLRDAKARAVKHNIERKIDEIAAIGDTASGITGFTNNASVGTTTFANGAWSTATADEIVQDMTDLASEVVTESDGVFAPDTIVLPVAEYEIAASRRLGDTQVTALKFFLDTNPHVKSVEQWWRLDTAGSGSVARAIAYEKDPDNLHLEMPLMLEILDPQERNLTTLINAIAMTAGTIITRPLSMQYGDFDT